MDIRKEDNMNTERDLFYELEHNLPNYIQLVIPDDLTIIQELIEHGCLDQKEEALEAADKWISKTYYHKLNMYDYSQKELDDYEKNVKDTFAAVREILWESIVQCMGDIGGVIYGTINNNVENIVYWYNINAPFHQKQPVNYRELIKALRASI